MKIVNFNEKYREKVEKICLLTGPGDAITNPIVGDYILSTYCRYYLDNEPENCFVLVDENDICRGYILCSESFNKYKIGAKRYLKSIKEVGVNNAAECRLEIAAHWLFRKKYPAHLHINIEEGYRCGGNGTNLVQTLLAHLKSKNVQGISLICDYGNFDARRFYERNGFSNGLSFLKQGLLMKREIK